MRCHQSTTHVTQARRYPRTLTSALYLLSTLWYTCEWNKGWSKLGVSPKARMDISESGKDPACNACNDKYNNQ